MKVKMNLTIAGEAPVYGLASYDFKTNDIVDLDPVLAKAWIEAGHASPVDDDTVLHAGTSSSIETAALETPETAVPAPPARKKRG